jgi:DNA-binding transcriptional LysR family regulator
MNLRSLDLNLLLVFDAIYAERSISRAAQKLNLSQPAVSNALARLRERLQDPLFERNSQGMSPTPRAKVLKEPIHQALDLLERGLRSDETFEYASSNREFVIAVEDYGESVVLPRLMDWLAATAPDVRITIRPEPSNSLKDAMRDGQVDLALDYFVLSDHGFNNKCVLTESLVSLTRQDHPGIGERLSLDAYLEQRHVVVMPRARTQPMIDLALSKRGLKRKISPDCAAFHVNARCRPDFQHDLHLAASHGPTCTQITFASKSTLFRSTRPEFPVYLIWHDSFDADPGHQWLRNHLIGLCASL